MNKLIMKEDEDILSFFRTLDHMVERLDGLSRNYRPMLNEGKLPYIQLGGKVLYKESDIERMLQNGYKEAWQARQMP